MEDIYSQVLRMKSNGGLTIDSAPLEAILLNITQALKNHDLIFSKFPEIETVQCSIQKDLSKLRVALESSTSCETDGTDAFRQSNVLGEGDLETSDNLATDDATNSYGLRKCSIERIQRKRAEDSDIANNLALANGLRDVKAKIRRLQQDRDEALANSLELDGSFKSLKEDLLILKQELTASASMSQLQMLQQSLVAKYSQMQAHLDDFKARFRDEVHEHINKYLVDVKASFTALERFLKQRQDKLETIAVSCAKEYDVAAFRDNVESDITSLMRKASFLDDTAKAQGKTLVMLQQKNAIVMFHRRYREWKRQTLKLGITRWKQVVQRQIKYEDGKQSQKRLMKKILTNIMSRRKRFGLEKWIRYRDKHRKTERLKVKASALIYDRMGLSFSASKGRAFNKWRRMAVEVKMKCSNEYDACRGDASKNIGDQLSNCEGAQPGVSGRMANYNLNAILDSLRTDAYGASLALAKEIENIKSQDIAMLRRDLVTENENLTTTINLTIEQAVEKINNAAVEFQTDITQRVDDCSAQFPPICSQLIELTNLLRSQKTELKNVEESNGKRIDTLLDRTDELEKRIHLVEELARNDSIQIATMMKEQSKANDAMKHLYELIATNEARRNEETKALRDIMDHFGDELLKTKVTLGHTQVRCENLEKELANTTHELSYFQETSQSENDKVSHLINFPGIKQTNMDRIVRVGHAYENLAKEKNYVTGISVTATMTSVSGPQMKSTGQIQKRVEQIDVPAEIASFAHDYGNWIAYQADHESLLRLIAGTNPDEYIYAEDDTIARRKSLLDELKSKLSAELERAAYRGVLDSTDCSTRGLGLRWEARAIFLARVLDATKAALSKHDQVMLPLSTRLGRTKPSTACVTVCVACDRPMRKNRSHLQKDQHKQEGESSQKNGKSGQLLETNEPKRMASAESTESSKQGKVLEARHHTDVGTNPRNSSSGKLVRWGTHLAESMKENSSNPSNEQFA
ncbi:hypothetical protein HJC23_009172 [Cyclotella cryptica]|uniref:Uncharacterized protein n=1 Tax=Cyclotella cryptica TaxID=29204 RepID=A0ABD3PKQ1_9STRA